MALSEKDIGRLEADMHNLKDRLDGHEARVDKRLSNIEGYIQEIRDAANMGKGMFWLLLKIGAVLSALVAGGVWVWEKVSHVGDIR